LRDDGVPLLTLTGPGGVGKTRLALEIAADLEADYDGVVFLPLAAVSEPTLVLPTVARVLGVLEGARRSVDATLALALRDRHLLLVLDNLEQVTGAAPALAALLDACPELHILATSRVPLHVRVEQLMRLDPLPTPEPEVPVEQLEATASVELFVERGRQKQPTFALRPENAVTIARIVSRLDGLPLAIELAAARLAMLSPEALLARLDHRLRLLTGGASDLPPRLRSMPDAIGWSYDLLEDRPRALFERLAVFSGGFELDAVASLTGDDPVTVLDELQILVEQSLVQRLDQADAVDGAESPDRFFMLETIREFALDRLAVSGHEAMIREAHAAYFLSWAESVAPHVDGPLASYWSQRCERELSNLRGALNWLLATGNTLHLTRLTIALSGYFFWQGHLREGSNWLTQALEVSDASSILRAGAMVALGYFVHALGDYPRSTELGSAALTLARDAGDRRVQAQAMHVLGLTEELQLHFDAARPIYEEELALCYEIGDLKQASFALCLLGGLSYGQDDLERAEALLNEAQALSRRAESPRWLAGSLWYLGLVMTRRGRVPDAARLYRESLTHYLEAGVQWWLTKPLAGLAAIAAMDGHPGEAAQLLGAAEAIWERSAAPVLPFDQPNLDRARQGAHLGLGVSGFAAAYARGRSMPFAEVLAVADAVVVAAVAPRRREGDPQRLTRREVDILRLVAQGLTDQEIAAALFLSRKTVSNHVATILGKLGVKTRTAAATRASEVIGD
jgi:predicted ATPase/DNA-binding CsgD family transcriptional regulator